jgi:hypothetical protein
MKRLAAFVLLLLVAAIPLCVSAEEFKLEPGFTRLDNGKDLSGWYPSTWRGKDTGDASGWSVVDGAIRLDCDRARNHLFSKARFGRTSTIRLQFLAARGADSGLCLHGKQFQLRDYPNSYPDTKRYAPHCKPPGEWNDLELAFTDGVGTIKLNGHAIEKQWKLGDNPDLGLGLQREKGDFRFRYLRIKTEKPERPEKPPR